MEYTWITMGMPAKLNLPDGEDEATFLKIKSLYTTLDTQFSTYLETSEISRYNRHEISLTDHSELEWILSECARTKQETEGYFDCQYGTNCDPSGLVKGYAISQAAKMLREAGHTNFLVEIAGDLQTSGNNEAGEPWTIGIENPFNRVEIVKVVTLSGQGLATSGTSIHPDHIINPLTHQPAHEIASISVIAGDVYDADRMATAAFAMGPKGIAFIEGLSGYDGYMVTLDKQGVMTTGFKQYVQ